ncbi:MAG: RdgB/HAM1 family non-canonical purine NTP pyrophosphatase [Candidatus Omnitrophota bacterium]
MTKKVLVATFNDKKRRELKILLQEIKGLEVLDLNDLDMTAPIIVEDGKTFRQNAVKKALTMSRFFDGLVVADDSGLEVDALDGRPGVRSARFARKEATDSENNEKLLKLLDKVPENKRRAKFVCHVALAAKGILLESFEGEIKGQIVLEPKGKNGFGYDPLFVPKGEKTTFADMPAADKNRISHRAMAMRKLKRSIRKHLKKKG